MAHVTFVTTKIAKIGLEARCPGIFLADGLSLVGGRIHAIRLRSARGLAGRYLREEKHSRREGYPERSVETSSTTSYMVSTIEESLGKISG